MLPALIGPIFVPLVRVVENDFIICPLQAQLILADITEAFAGVHQAEVLQGLQLLQLIVRLLFGILNWAWRWRRVATVNLTLTLAPLATGDACALLVKATIVRVPFMMVRVRGVNTSCSFPAPSQNLGPALLTLLGGAAAAAGAVTHRGGCGVPATEVIDQLGAGVA